ncbi:hypothetical protein [Mumia zhuanghuii]|uniref:Uncharacterized protein n=1 Tax=Mumia zhuanghuii TaxID=2585211 RepID=A0A5C4LU22_9ACTN|nr:hypothetical protein [Mumia zhuanghuii]TNC22039.1 hypothetical protein FHE65_36200 [Mumia zhuanghuii]TNC22184.1 hypothetical protein FHE65_35895 [Mumia zhuanghuii]
MRGIGEERDSKRERQGERVREPCWLAEGEERRDREERRRRVTTTQSAATPRGELLAEPACMRHQACRMRKPERTDLGKKT